MDADKHPTPKTDELASSGDLIDAPAKIVRFAEHNVGLVAAALLCLVVTGCGALGGFEGRAIDPVTGEQATAQEIEASANAEIRSGDAEILKLNLEMQRTLAQIEMIDSELDELALAAQAAADQATAITNERLSSVDRAVEVVASIFPGAGPIATAALAVVGAGLGFDNLRKNRVIKREKAKQSAQLVSAG